MNSNTTVSRSAIVLFIVATGFVVPGTTAKAQSLTPTKSQSRTAAKATSTSVEVQLVTSRPQAALQAQKWGRLFDKIGYRIRIRRADATDKPDVSQKMLGSTRMVKVLGRLNNEGDVELPGGNKFTTADEAKLKKWLDDLKIYGAQGAPEGKPMWGLNSNQFTDVYNQLSAVTRQEVEGLNLRSALKKFEIPQQLPIRISDAASIRLRTLPDTTVVQNKLMGTSKATGLAIALADFGLGFHPKRTPSGGTQLSIIPLSEKQKPWPIGWQPKVSNPKTAPLLFKLFPVELEESSIVDLMSVVSTKTEVPIHFDHGEIAASKIKLDELTITIPKRKATLYRAVQTAVSRNKLAQKLRIDELGKPFLYITTSAASRAVKMQAMERPGL